MVSFSTIQVGSYQPAPALKDPLSNYVPYKYGIKNLVVPYTDEKKLRSPVDYQKAILLQNPELVYAELVKVFGEGHANESVLQLNDRVKAAASSKILDGVTQNLAALHINGLIENELCPKDEGSMTLYDFVSTYVFLDQFQTELKKQGKSLADTEVILKEQFVGTDFRRTEYGKNDPIFTNEAYPDHHMLIGAEIMPDRESEKGTYYFPSLYDSSAIPAANGPDGILINQTPPSDSSIKKMKTVSNPKRELDILEKIRALGGRETIADGNFIGKETELNKLIAQMELRYLVTNDANLDGANPSSFNATIFDLNIAAFCLSQFMQNLAMSGYPFEVDFFEEFLGTNSRHVISSVLVRPSIGVVSTNGAPAVKEVKINELQETLPL